MLDFYISGGPGMHFFLVIFFVIIYLTVKRSRECLGGADVDPKQFQNGVNAILFWGVIALVLGYLWHYMGVYTAMGAIQIARDISPGIVAKGYQMSLVTILTGQTIFILSGIIWYVLRTKARSV